MYEVEKLLQRILDELKEMNSNINDTNDKLDSIQGTGLYNSISEIYEKLESIQGSGLYNSINDVCDKLDEVKDGLSDVESSVSSLG